jgi:hypothetical protein
MTAACWPVLCRMLVLLLQQAQEQLLLESCEALQLLLQLQAAKSCRSCCCVASVCGPCRTEQQR